MLHLENMKDVKIDLNKWKDIPCFWTGRFEKS